MARPRIHDAELSERLLAEASVQVAASGPDGLSLRPAPLHGGRWRTYADHRMAHAGVIVGAAVDGVLVEDVATTAKTFPDFAPFWASLVEPA